MCGLLLHCFHGTMMERNGRERERENDHDVEEGNDDTDVKESG